MWSTLKYLYLAIRLGTLWENLQGVKAKDPATTSEAYQPAAAAVLEDPGVQRWLAGLSPADQVRFVEGLPVFVWGLDAMTE
jgi:hypothetical protein